MPTTQSPSVYQLKRALEIAQQIEKLESELDSILGSAPAPKSSAKIGAPAKIAAPAKNGKKKGTLSPEAREKIAQAQRARWSRVKAAKAPAKAASSVKAVKFVKAGVAAKAAPTVKAKRVVSEQARRKMAEAARKRWAAKKA